MRIEGMMILPAIKVSARKMKRALKMRWKTEAKNATFFNIFFSSHVFS